MKYIKKFKKVIYGFIETEADNKKEAFNNFNNGDYNEFDNKEDYEFEDIEEDK